MRRLCKVFLLLLRRAAAAGSRTTRGVPVYVELQFEPLSTLCDVTRKVAYSCTYAGAHTTALRQVIHKPGLCRTPAWLRPSGKLTLHHAGFAVRFYSHSPTCTVVTYAPLTLSLVVKWYIACSVLDHISMPLHLLRLAPSTRLPLALCKKSC